MLWRVLLAAVLWLAAPVSAAVVNGPKALRTLQRYDLPGGGNLPALILDAIHRKFELPLDVRIPVALRLFGSSVYLADERTNTVDWKNVGDIDGVVYVEQAEHLLALKREHPYKTADWYDDKQRGALKSIEEAVSKRLAEIADRLGGYKQPSLSVPDAGFAMLKENLFISPIPGYHPYEPHFGNEPGIAGVRSIAEKLHPAGLDEAIRIRELLLRGDIERRLDIGAIDAKLIKRFIQAAVLLGDAEETASYKRLLATNGALGLDRASRKIAAGLMARSLSRWRHPDFARHDKLSATVEKSVLSGANLVVIPR